MGRRVLIVDGNRDAAESLALLLQIHGHEVATAHTGPDGLAEAGKFLPDAGIVAIHLHGFDGYELCRRLKSGAAGVSVPLLIALTGHALETDRKAARQAGFDHHVVKPADPAAIFALLDA